MLKKIILSLLIIIISFFILFYGAVFYGTYKLKKVVEITDFERGVCFDSIHNSLPAEQRILIDSLLNLPPSGSVPNDSNSH